MRNLLAKGQERSCGTKGLGRRRAGPLMGTRGLPPGSASPAARMVRGRGWGGGEGDGLGTETAQALEMGETQGQKSTTACRREQVT